MGKYGSTAFDRRISILRPMQQLDDAGKPMGDSDPQSYLEAWASYEPVSDQERLTHQHVTALTARFVVRWSTKASGILSSDKLRFDGKTFGIVGVKEIGRRRYLEITAGTHEA